MNEEYAAEFQTCDEMAALQRSNMAAAGTTVKGKEDEPKSSTWNGMKRKTPLRAKTGLQTKTPLKTKSELQRKPLAPAARGDELPQADTPQGSVWNGLQRKTPLKAKSPMKPKPSRRRYGHLVKNGWCAVCGKAGATEWHHIIFRSHGGDEADENMLEVCRECHEKIHARLISPDEIAFARLTAGSYLEENQRTTTYGAGAGA